MVVLCVFNIANFHLWSVLNKKSYFLVLSGGSYYEAIGMVGTDLLLMDI